MLAEIVPWQWLLDGLGAVLAWIYDLIPNYGVAIIILTILIKIVLLPLAWKQIKSMQHVQALQPRIKEIQKKYKNNKAKQQEETMRLYREAGVNPLGGCLPILLLYPFLIAMYSVIRPVQLVPAEQPDTFQVGLNVNHIPEDSALFQNIITHENVDFLALNLLCTPRTAGTQAPQTYRTAEGETAQLPDGDPILGEEGQPLGFEAFTQSTLDCGAKRFPAVIPYGVVLALMVVSGFYMQRQTMKNSPPGSQSSQQQAILKYMPIMFGFFGLGFPAGLLIYWTSSNGFQVVQQAMMLRAGHIGPDALDRRIEEQRRRAESPAPKQGIMERMAAKADEAERKRQTRQGGQPTKKANPRNPSKPPSKPTKPKGAPPGNQLGKKKPDDGGKP